MEAFGWWFGSGKLDEDWSTEQFLKVLDFTKKISGDHYIIKRLIALAETKPMQAIAVLTKLAQRDRQQWILFGSESNLKLIFSKALRSPDIQTQTVARELINRLVAWGYKAYEDLLLPPSPSDPTTESYNVGSTKHQIFQFQKQ